MVVQILLLEQPQRDECCGWPEEGHRHPVGANQGELHHHQHQKGCLRSWDSTTFPNLLKHIRHTTLAIQLFFSIFNLLIFVFIWAAESRDAACEAESRDEKPFHLKNENMNTWHFTWRCSWLALRRKDYSTTENMPTIVELVENVAITGMTNLLVARRRQRAWVCEHNRLERLCPCSSTKRSYWTPPQSPGGAQWISDVCSPTQMTTMRSARSMREVETPRNQSSLLSLTLIFPSFSAHLVSKLNTGSISFVFNHLNISNVIA